MRFYLLRFSGRLERTRTASVAGVLFVLPGLFAGAQAASDIAIQKTVIDPTLAPGAAVEFTVTVSNLGPDLANTVYVTDWLPPELAIPIGVVPFTSLGVYDVSANRWGIDQLAAGESAVLVLPAQVADVALPLCVVNEALVEPYPDDPDPNNDRASAALRMPGIERCVDLSIGQQSFMLADPYCANSTRALLSLSVTNHGPDSARQVVVDVAVNPEVVPGLVFNDPQCTTVNASTCVVEEIGVGESISLSLRSQQFKNSSGKQVTVTATVSSPDPEVGIGDGLSVQNWYIPQFSDCTYGIPTGGGGGGCFIATAAFGSALHPHVESLRHFRDQYLLTNGPGRMFVGLYYRYSPPLAGFIAVRPALRVAVRGLLWPLVFAVERPLPAAALTICLAWALWSSARWRRLHRAGLAQAPARCESGWKLRT
jgi:uncharacterized repeat protein (TIGR01451 family)